MAGARAEAAAEVSTSDADPDGAVLVKLVYGVKELGSVLPCSRCITAERVARRVALKYPGRVFVRKYDVTSAEAAELGIVLSPTVLVNDELVAAGTGISEERLDEIVRQHLECVETGPIQTEGGDA
jgi:hypothetical protein